jgi:hypothetical protein
MKMHMGIEVQLHSLNLRTPWVLFCWEKSVQFLFERKLSKLQRESGHSGKNENLCNY